MNNNANKVFESLEKSIEEVFDLENDQYIETPFHLIESYFKGQHLERLVKHQLESYNNFVSHQIIKTIEMFNPVHIASEQDFDPTIKKHSLELFVTFENFNIYRPQIYENNGAIKLMFPQEARLRNFTYASAMTVDMNIKYIVRTGPNLENTETFYKTLHKIHIGKLPIMLKSSICVLSQYKHVDYNQTGECRFDAGGYFIINGSEKTVLGQERAAENKVYCFNISKNNTKYHWLAEIKSVPDFKCISPKQINMMVSSKNNGFGHVIHVQIPRVKQPLPLFIVFRALGVLTDKEICEKILLDLDSIEKQELLNALQASIMEADKFLTQEDCIKHITSYVMYTPINMDKETGARKKLEFTMDILNNDLFPHCHNKTEKIYFLGYMANKLLQTSFKILKTDDRDSYANKRIDLTGTLLNNLFRNYFNKLVKDMEKQVIREINTGSWRSKDDYENIMNLTNIYKIIKSTTIENGIKRALATGDFGIKNTNSNKVGVAQVLNRLTYVSSLSHARRISTPTDKSGKLIPPRKLHNTSWGYLCPAETPEGQSVGIVKNLSYMTHITIYSNSMPLYEYILPDVIILDQCTKEQLYDLVKVFINGAWVGVSETPEKLYNSLKDKKYQGIINIYTSIIFDYRLKEIRVCNDGGRLCRPVLRIKNNNILLNQTLIKKLNASELIWDDLLTNAKIPDSVLEYIDPDEQNLSIIATVPKDLIKKADSDFIYKYTHCEIHPSTIFGILASCIPFPENNQSPRNCYQCLDLNEMVLMKDGLQKKIADVKVGEEVISFHAETKELSITKVINHFIIPNQVSVYKLTFLNNKSIIATFDHKFMTNYGWLTVEKIINLNLNPEIGIFLNNNSAYTFIKIIHFEIVSNRLVCDITVESENHSFITSHGIMSSNCAQGKQAMGVYVTNYENRMDKTAYVLNYPTRPLVDTRIMNMIQLNKIPSGTNVIVAIMTHTGYNQEDSLLFNKGSIDRGLFVTTVYHTEKDEDKQKINGDEEIRCKPDPLKTKGMKMANYQKVNSKGVIPENTIVENRDIIISKVIPIKENRNDHTKIIKFEDQSKLYRTTEETYIDKNYIDKNGDGYNFAKVRLRTVRKPVIGDKFCSLPTQQVLTNHGWIEIKDVDILKHQLATLDINGKLTYEFPSAKFEYDHEDKMYSIQNKQVHIVCTLNHRLYVKKRAGKAYELLEAKDVMGKMCRFKKNMENVWPDQAFFELGEEKYAMDDWLKLLGMFISDGCCDNRVKRVSITALKDRKRLYLESIFKNLNISYIYEQSGNFRISGKINENIYNYFLILSVGSLNKFLPNFIWNLSQRQSIILLEALLQGDGSSMEYKGETFDRYGTISIQLANDITRLALHCGWSGINKISEEPSGIARIGKRNLGSRAGQEVSITQKHTYYKVSIIRKQNEPWINKKQNESNEEKLIDYQGKVYCVEMPSSHTYYMRESNFSPCLIIGNSSRHGQKGTIGNIIPECDMPFTNSGIRPDIIINPHAIPSRMTIGQLKETLLGKVLVELGLFGDGTSFGKLDIMDIRKELLKVGYESNGEEIMNNGLTGEQVECSVFIGPVFYQRLKHMVVDKAHSRSIGPMVNLTRQPAEGRSRDGGLRFGEMERDCFQYRAPIPLNCGLSIEIGTMENNNLDVLGYKEKNEEKNSGIIVPAKQSAFLCKGERECIEMTLQDGRKIICTPDHRLLKSNGEWTKANEFKVIEEKVKVSVNYPLIKIKEEILECNGWSINVGNIHLTTDNTENFMKTLAFARILGYIMNDGGIYYLKKIKKNVGYVSLGHMIDVEVLINDLELFYPIIQEKFEVNNFYRINLNSSFVKDLLYSNIYHVGAKITQPAQLPEFLLDPLCPRPIVREFLGGMFGADGHTCVLGMHRGKRDILSSISFSKCKKLEHLESLTKMFENIKILLKKCGIEKTTIQKFKETTYSKNTNFKDSNKSYQLTLHLDIEELVPFSEKIGFRYCCHKSQRLEAGVSYKRLRNEVTRQHNWIVQRVNEITDFVNSKKENPLKSIQTKKAIEQATNELKLKEPLIHEYAIPNTHDITDHLIKGTTFGKFTSKSFPTAEEYLREIGALDWFLQDLDYKKNIKDLEDFELEDKDLEEIDNNSSRYGVERVKEGLPTMELKVIDIRPAGIHKVYDIQVDEVHSFLANGIVAHNCMISHGASRFTRERMYDVSDKYHVYACKKCGSIASYNDAMKIHHCKICDNRVDFAYVEIPYSCKLLFQELNTMNIAPRIITKQE